MVCFPEHHGEAELYHNDHLSYYTTVNDEIEDDKFNIFDDSNWVSIEEKQKSIESNELWSFRWEPEKDGKTYWRHANTLVALMTSFGLDWSGVKFPDHKVSLYLIHNSPGFNRLENTENVAEKLEDESNYFRDDDWESLDEKQKAIDTNELWTLHWYPDTPIGFCLRHAASLESLLKGLHHETL